MNIISTIVVNHNSGSKLVESVESIVKSDVDAELEILVIDNASKDKSVNFLKERFEGDARVRLLENSLNLGFSKACNQGVSQAKGQYLFFLNPDCVLEATTMKRLLLSMQQNTNVGMVGGLLLNPDGSEQAGGRRSVPTPWLSFVRAFRLDIISNHRIFNTYELHKEPIPSVPIAVEAISGACMFVRKEAVHEVGLMDERYFMHCDDLDWCMRFAQKGWEIMFVPDAEVVHFKGACSKARPLFVEWHKHRGMMRFYNKFFRHQYPGILMWMVGLGVWVRFSIVGSLYCVKHIAGWFGLRHG